MVGTSNQSVPEMAIENMMNLREGDKPPELVLFLRPSPEKASFQPSPSPRTWPPTGKIHQQADSLSRGSTWIICSHVAM